MGRLLGKVFRQAGYMVAELDDHHRAVSTLQRETAPIAAVVASFSLVGHGASLRLLDAIRNHPEPKVNQLKVLLVSDQPRQQVFCLQAGADGILLRPFHVRDILGALAEMIERPEAERVAYRRGMIDQITRAEALRGHPLQPTFEGATASG